MNVKSTALVFISAQLQFSQPFEAVRFGQQQAEAAYGPLMGVQSNQSNAPDAADPNIARILFVQTNGARLSLSKLRVQLDMDFSKSGLSSDARFDAAKEKIARFVEASASHYGKAFFSTDNLTAIVRSESDLPLQLLNRELTQEFLPRLTAYDPLKFQVGFGFSKGDYECGLDFSSFEDLHFAGQIKVDPNKFTVIKRTDMISLAQGVILKIDVKPNDIDGYDVNSKSASSLAALHEALEKDVPALIGIKVFP